PAAELEAAGYSAIWHGQKSWNGVAILSRGEPIVERVRALPGDDEDAHSRHIEADIAGLTVGCLYLPNGNPAPGPKFDYKLKWLARLKKHAKELLALEEALVITGDYNVIPEPEDAHDPKAWKDDALFRPESRAAYREILNLGFTDAIRQIHPAKTLYTFWDYQRGAWEKDHGIRIDHLLLSPQAADRLKDAGVDRAERGRATSEAKPSDHVPVWVELR
ncbi:MAG TPA: exodeoxyribonuclease III, partial [Parvularculaceae bacterium]|nr:exodeoxyribonuclease III [Parvularculaceae bacterium]